MSNKGEFLSKVANLASRFDNEDEILEEAEEIVEEYERELDKNS